MNTRKTKNDTAASETARSSTRHAKGTGKRKILIKEIDSKQQKMVTFSKRREGLYRKADEFNSVIGFEFAIVVFSPGGRIYTHGNPSMDVVLDDYFKFIKKEEEKNKSDMWLDCIGSMEYDDVAELVALKEKLCVFKEKAGEKLQAFSDIKKEGEKLQAFSDQNIEKTESESRKAESE